MRISSTDHRVEVVAEERGDVAVEGRAHVAKTGATWTVDRVRGRVTVRMPIGSDVVVGTTSGRVEVRGRAGDVAVVTESGRIEIEHARSVDARSDSSRVEVGRVDGTCRVRSVAGRVAVRSCGDADVATRSGRIELPDVHGTVRSHCVSGRIEVGLASAHDVDAETVSGRVSVSLPAGVRAHRPDIDDGSLAVDADCTILARSVSGRVEVSSQ